MRRLVQCHNRICQKIKFKIPGYCYCNKHYGSKWIYPYFHFISPAKVYSGIRKKRTENKVFGSLALVTKLIKLTKWIECVCIFYKYKLKHIFISITGQFKRFSQVNSMCGFR